MEPRRATGVDKVTKLLGKPRCCRGVRLDDTEMGCDLYILVKAPADALKVGTRIAL
jgi:hypothetical protein